MNGFCPGNYVRTALVIAAVLANGACSTKTSKPLTHAGDLATQTDGDNILPSRASTKDGKPYTGDVYETFFGDKKPKNCTEWEGAFIDGTPAGEFKLYSNCGQLHSLWRFENGVWAMAKKM